MIARDPEIVAIAVREDELSLLAFALQRGGAVTVCNLVRGFELQDPWYGAYLDEMASRLAKGQAVDEESMMYVVFANRIRFGSAADYANITDLATGMPRTTSALEDLVARIKERHLLRAVGWAANALRAVSLGDPTHLGTEPLPYDPAEATAKVGQHLLQLIAPTTETEEADIGASATMAAEERRVLRESGQALALSTGHTALNEILSGGFRGGELIVVAGQTSSGKTAFSLGAACQVAEIGKRVGIVSLEMPRGEVGDRLLARVGDVDLRALRSGMLDTDPDVAGWRDYLADLQMPVWHPPGGATLAQIGAKAMAWKAKGLSMLVIDHLGRVKGDSASERLRYDLQVAAVAKGAKTLALSLRVPVLLLVQLNREGSKRSEDFKNRVPTKANPKTANPEPGPDWWRGLPMPQLSDLKESSSIEQEADVVLFPVRAAELGSGAPDQACIVVAKQRNGPKGTVPAIWNGHSASYICASAKERA